MLLEVLLCMALLGLMIAVVDLPLRFSLRSEQQLSRFDRVNRSFDDLAIGLSIRDYQPTFLTLWQAQLRRDIPGVTIRYHIQSSHRIWVQVEWPSAPGMPSVGAKSNELERSLVFAD